MWLSWSQKNTFNMISCDFDQNASKSLELIKAILTEIYCYKTNLVTPRPQKMQTLKKMINDDMNIHIKYH